MKTFFLVALLVGLLIVSSWWAIDVWLSLNDVEMGGPGIVAMILGVVFTIAIGGGLMFLVFYSNRKGYDDIDGQHR